MIDDDHDGCGDQNPPIAITGEKREGTEYVKVRFDPPSRQMYK